MSVNKVILIGNLTKDPEVRNVGDTQVAKFSLAMNERGYTKQDGTVVPDRAEFIDVEVWRGLASVVHKYVKKGDKIYIEGKLKTQSWDAEDGTKRYRTFVNAFFLEMLGGKVQEEPHQEQAANNNDDLPF